MKKYIFEVLIAVFSLFCIQVVADPLRTAEVIYRGKDFRIELYRGTGYVHTLDKLGSGYSKIGRKAIVLSHGISNYESKDFIRLIAKYV